MSSNSTVVVDVGKTNAKMSLWDEDGTLIDRSSRANALPVASPDRSLDRRGIEQWMMNTLAGFALQADVRRIVPVGHGAAAVLIRDGKLFAEPTDYEEEYPDSARATYRAQRDPFQATGSPFLPCGLNLGMQLHSAEEDIGGPLPDDVTILPWPQYWAWRLSGVHASEVTSLGTHTDLWRPSQQGFSKLATDRGWAARIAPLRYAGESLGPITPAVAKQTGLPADCVVLCGLHDSNAALLAARGHVEIAESDATVLSTGTWFIAMRSLAGDTAFDASQLAEARDCLINVDVAGRPVPSARFMGGREAEMIGAFDAFAVARDYEPQQVLDRVAAIVASGACALPTFAPGVGPFPESVGHWQQKPDDATGVRVVAELYLALVANTMLDLIGSCDRLLIEGRFAEAEVFVRALAALRPQQRIYTSNAEHDVAYGALRLTSPSLAPAVALSPVQALDIDLRHYAATWRKLAANGNAK